MTQPNPANPANAANPGNSAPVQPSSSAASQAPVTNQGAVGQQEEKVSISLKEFRDLQRDHARVLSFEKRKEFNRKNSSPVTNADANPDVAEEIRQRDEIIEETAFQLHRERVANRVRNILEKPEYSTLPKSTKDLILQNPAMLSESDDVEEALLDIEDFVREKVADIVPSSQNQSGQGGSRATIPAGHETPPVSVGAPVRGNPVELEDVSKLTGTARSRAILRNKMKANRVK